MNNTDSDWTLASDGLPEPEAGEPYTVRTRNGDTYDGRFMDWGFTIDGTDKFIDCSRIEAYRPATPPTESVEEASDQYVEDHGFDEKDRYFARACYHDGYLDGAATHPTSESEGVDYALEQLPHIEESFIRGIKKKGIAQVRHLIEKLESQLGGSDES